MLTQSHDTHSSPPFKIYQVHITEVSLKSKINHLSHSNQVYSEQIHVNIKTTKVTALRECYMKEIIHLTHPQ